MANQVWGVSNPTAQIIDKSDECWQENYSDFFSLGPAPERMECCKWVDHYEALYLCTFFHVYYHNIIFFAS